MTLQQLSQQSIARLAPRYGEREARYMWRIIMEQIKGYNQVDTLIHASDEVSPFIAEKVDQVVARLLHDEPIQYIFGTARFMGNDFKVTTDTLIPRPETEGLVDMIVDHEKQHSDLRLLDVGTGSGCIAIMLARNLPFASVDAIDVSAPAIEVARENALALRASVNFSVADIFTMPRPLRPYDLIVSNPPYIAESEAAQMDPNVLRHEPHSALFVPDDDPLRFYRVIAQYGQDALRQGGRLYFEINPLFARQLQDLLMTLHYTDTDLQRDQYGRVRYLSARL